MAFLRGCPFAALLAAAGAQRPPSWAGDYYRFRIEKNSDRWTIHGLWPNWSPYEYCRDDPFDVENVHHLRTRLNRDWPSNSGNNEGFWKHEWEKHGTCGPFTQQTYFERSLELYDAHAAECDAATGYNCNLCWDRNWRRCDCGLNGPSTPGQCPAERQVAAPAVPTPPPAGQPLPHRVLGDGGPGTADARARTAASGIAAGVAAASCVALSLAAACAALGRYRRTQEYAAVVVTVKAEASTAEKAPAEDAPACNPPAGVRNPIYASVGEVPTMV